MQRMKRPKSWPLLPALLKLLKLRKQEVLPTPADIARNAARYAAKACDLNGEFVYPSRLIDAYVAGAYDALRIERGESALPPDLVTSRLEGYEEWRNR